MHKLNNLWTLLLLLLCSMSLAQTPAELTENYIVERLPDWFVLDNPLDGIEYSGTYRIDNRLNPLYLEADFNGDGHIDIALPIEHIKYGKVGYMIVHGTTHEVHIIGAGTPIKNNPSESFEYIDIWRVGRSHSYPPGLEESSGTGPEGELIIETPVIQIEKSEVGGGLIYWDGKQYAYFHRTC